MRDDRDSEGRLLYITMEGVAHRDPETALNQLLHHLKKFPVYLLGPANDMIGTIIMNAYKQLLLQIVQLSSGYMSFSALKSHSRMSFHSADLTSRNDW